MEFGNLLGWLKDIVAIGVGAMTLVKGIRGKKTEPDTPVATTGQRRLSRHAEQRKKHQRGKGKTR